MAKTQLPDIAAQIVYAMRTMGIASIPRNYELFYEAYIGANPALSRDLAALGSHATQDELDTLGERYFSSQRSRVVEQAHSRIISQLESLLRALHLEQNSLESYNRLLGDTVHQIASKSNSNADILRNAINILTVATGDTMAQGEKTVENVQQKSQEMDVIRKELDEYKRIANTDSLTRLSNRRAFDERLASVFDAKQGVQPTGLILMDIDHFKHINDSYGHPVGDKILATVGTVIRTNVRREAFVARTGGEEFAIILDGASREEVYEVCERIRMALESTPFRNSKTGIDYGQVTISLGGCMATEVSDAGELYGKADIALYCAKNDGRNRTRLFEDGMKKDFSKSWLIYRRG